jgi:hypothetical protein
VRARALRPRSAALARAGCAADSTDDGLDEATNATSEDALTSAGGNTTLYYLGSSSFLRQCAGETLGCGRAVSSISNSTPYFSAPRSWGRTACNEWYPFRVNGKCVEAQRFEVSDKRNYIEGNPAVRRARPRALGRLALRRLRHRAQRERDGGPSLRLTPASRASLYQR